jgi:hydroxyacylglutathione hydrolase
MSHKLQIIPISAFEDNYIWLLHNGKQAIVVDPGDATPVIVALNTLNLQLQSILITHHHHDHIDGVKALMQAFPNVLVYAPSQEKYSFKHASVFEPNIIQFEDFNHHNKPLSFSVINLPGHTLGHVAYYAEGILFCGDTLFGAGCGRLFEGTPAQMYTSLQKLAVLPQDTQVFCTHEYTLHNIHFALTLEPKNKALLSRLTDTQKLRQNNLPSLPSSIHLELCTNPFLRCNTREFQRAIQQSISLNSTDPLNIFTTIRQMRNLY